MSDILLEIVRRLDAIERRLNDQLGVEIAPGGGSLGAHAATHASGGSDPLSPAAIGAATAAALGAHEALTTGAHGGIVAPSDPRLTDARTPTAHAATHASGGSDPVTPAVIGALDLAGGTMTGPITLADSASLDNRISDMWVVPTDHFATFSGWTWAGAPFAGAPATATTATLGSLLNISDSVLADRFFTYKSTGSTSDVYARVAAGSGPRVGVRVDDGTDNNYVEVYMEDSATTGFKRIARAIRAGGGAVATLTIADNLPNMWLVVRAQKTASQIFTYYGVDTPVVALLGSGVAAAWTAARAGIIYIQNVAGRSAVVDWIRL